MKINEIIRKLTSGDYRLYSKDGKKNLGTYDTKAAAEKRERQVQYFKHANEAEKLELPDLEVGDEVKVGKFKNRRAEVTGFEKDEHGQPVLKTTKGDQKLFKPRVSKLEPEQVNEISMDRNTGKADLDVDDLDEFIGRTEHVTTIDGHEIHLLDEDAPEEYIWLVGDESGERFVGYLSFTTGAYAGNDFYKSNVFFDESLQGKGLAVKLYVYAIKSSGITLVSDKTQTPGSKKLWATLAKQSGINVYGWNISEYLKLDRAGKNTDSAFFHWDPNTDLDDEVYTDSDKDQEAVVDARRRMQQAAQQLKSGEISDSEYEEYVAQLNKQIQDMNSASIAGADVRLVATAK